MLIYLVDWKYVIFENTEDLNENLATAQNFCSCHGKLPTCSYSELISQLWQELTAGFQEICFKIKQLTSNNTYFFPSLSTLGLTQPLTYELLHCVAVVLLGLMLTRGNRVIFLVLRRCRQEKMRLNSRINRKVRPSVLFEKFFQCIRLSGNVESIFSTCSAEFLVLQSLKHYMSRIFPSSRKKIMYNSLMCCSDLCLWAGHLNCSCLLLIKMDRHVKMAN